MLIYFLGMHDDIEVMPSLQRPKKLCFIGNNGRKYNFLAKPEDDLRKDARLMEFNSMINKLLKGNTDTRKRNLCTFVTCESAGAAR